MISDEQIPQSLPDTQNADAVNFTQSQDLVPSQKLTVWGRLCPTSGTGAKTLEMTKNEYSLGRSDKCDICITSDVLKEKWRSTISKVHFKIVRERINDSTYDFVVYLEDLSHNGTFVNKKKIGRGNRIILESNDLISMAQPMLGVYVYMSTASFETSELPSELKSKYVVSRKLGSGACGEVKLVFSKDGSKRFAMKIITKMRSATNGYKQSLNDPEKIMNEVEILKSLRHPCVIKLEEIVDTSEAVYILLELMEGGELFERITSRGKLSEKDAKLIFYQVVLAVHYLHECGITHRDLKPENILLSSHADITLAKVSDFGLSKLVDAQTMMRTFCGTPMYVAPEILLTSGRGSYTNQVDVWSLGVILYACLSGSVPFNVQNKNISLENQIKKGLYSFPSSKFGHLSAKATHLIRRMMTVDPKNRITIKQVLLHPWLQDREIRNLVDVLITENNDENTVPLNLQNNEQYRHNLPIKRPRIEL